MGGGLEPPLTTERTPAPDVYYVLTIFTLFGLDERSYIDFVAILMFR